MATQIHRNTLFKHIIAIYFLIISMLVYTTPVYANTGVFCVPTEGFVTQRYNARNHPALDLAKGPKFVKGPAVRAVYPGKVVKIYGEAALPNRPHIVEIDHGVIPERGKRVWTIYAHLGPDETRPWEKYIQVELGQQVEIGTLLGFQGMAGDASGTHLHWVVKEGPIEATDSTQGVIINPELLTGSIAYTIPSQVTCKEQANPPPNVPVIRQPASNDLITGTESGVNGSAVVTFTWQDTGDPNNGPRASRDYFVEVLDVNGNVIRRSNWHPVTAWTTRLPFPGVYQWRVMSGDGQKASLFSPNTQFTLNTLLACPRKRQGDVNCDGLINISDFSVMAFDWQTTGARADFNASGYVDISDFSLLAYYYETSSAVAEVLPYPTTTSTKNLSQPSTTISFQKNWYDLLPNDTLEVDIMFKSTEPQQYFGTDIYIRYSQDIFEFKPVGENEEPNSATCLAASPDGLPVFKNQFSIEDNPVLGILKISRYTSIDNPFSIPAGEFCAATLRFTPKVDLAIPQTGYVLFEEYKSQWEVAGSSGSIPFLFESNKQVTVNIDTTVSLPVAPKDLSVSLATDESVQNSDGYSVLLEWQDVTQTREGFNILRWNSASNFWQKIAQADPQQTEFYDTGLACGTTIRYQIQAFNSRGVSESRSNEAAITAPCIENSTIFLPILTRR